MLHTGPFLAHLSGLPRTKEDERRVSRMCRDLWHWWEEKRWGMEARAVVSSHLPDMRFLFRFR